ncbi:hypothetical protein Tco_1082271 [Tanacetum coccineum]|uniref:Uncharacterized protein n=1 Tax=Tanacetum coccineum TaxID=301880 RepID=A0ABQ5HZY2_9ASTR
MVLDTPPPPPQPPTTTVNSVIKKKTMKKNKKKKNNKDFQNDVVSSESSNCCNSRSKGVRIAAINKRRISGGKKGGEVDALALPLGMSIAVFVAKVGVGERWLTRKSSFRNEDRWWCGPLQHWGMQQWLTRHGGATSGNHAWTMPLLWAVLMAVSSFVAQVVIIFNAFIVNEVRPGDDLSILDLVAWCSGEVTKKKVCAIRVVVVSRFAAQVLERKDANGEKIPVDHLSEVFGDRFDCFVNNFERSFQSTLMTFRVISETSGNRERSYLHGEGSSTCNSSDFHFDMKANTSSGQEQLTIVNLDDDNVYKNPIYNDVAVHQDPTNSQQLACVAPNRLHSGVNNRSVLTTFEKSVNEQARSNDLKALEISLSMQKIRLKEAQIAVNCVSNYLERFKLSMGISKANFKANKFKTELQDSRHAQLLKNCADCLVAGLLIMLSCLTYGTYIHSHQRLIEATESCMPTKESSSWWIPNPMPSFSSWFQILWCQVQVISRMLFGALMIVVALTYLLIQRSGTTNQTMPITFLLLLLGVGCGFAGKFCIDTLGGSGNHWLFYWEFLCLVHFFANVCTSMLFVILHGPVTVTGGSMGHVLFPYWLRRLAFYAIVLVYLPLLCGLMPFAGPGEWLEHFSGPVCISRWHESDLVFGVKVVSMLQVLVVDQMSAIRIALCLPSRLLLLTSWADCCSLLPEETLLLLLRRHCSLPPEETLLHLLRRHCSIVIASGPEVLARASIRGFQSDVSIGGSLTPYYGLDRRSRSVVFPSEGFQSEVSIGGLDRCVSISSALIGGSRGVSPSEDHEECLHRSITRSVSIGGSRGVSSSEVHEECLHRRITRSVSIGGLFLEGFNQIPHKGVSFGSTTKAFQAEKTQDDTDADSNATLEPIVDALPTIAHAEAPPSHNHVKSPWTQDNSTDDAPSDRSSKQGFEGVTDGRDASTNKLNEDADPNEGFPDDGFDDDDNHN